MPLILTLAHFSFLSALPRLVRLGMSLDFRWLPSSCWMAAGNHGFKEAFHNLGMLYKDSHQQDFNKACSYFQQGVDFGSVMCCYDQGYMLYKGLGCIQDYTKAVELFERGANRDHAPSLYMLGLCYRNGYGVERDMERATFLLNRSAILNYSRAMEELNREMPENSFQEISTDINQFEVPASMPDILPLTADVDELQGKYQGVLVTYDWSGKNIVSERLLSVDLSVKGHHLSGIWVEGKDSVLIKATVTDTGKLIFDKGVIKRHDRYVEDSLIEFRFEDADVSTEMGTITGCLRLYSTTLREPERPMYINLQKTLPNNVANEYHSESKIYAYPNPFSSQLTISFELSGDVPSANVGIYTQAGINLHTYNLGVLSQGKNSFSLSPVLPDGIYMLRVTAGQQRFQTIIIKKRNNL